MQYYQLEDDEEAWTASDPLVYVKMHITTLNLEVGFGLHASLLAGHACMLTFHSGLRIQHTRPAYAASLTAEHERMLLLPLPLLPLFHYPSLQTPCYLPMPAQAATATIMARIFFAGEFWGPRGTFLLPENMTAAYLLLGTQNITMVTGVFDRVDQLAPASAYRMVHTWLS